MVFTLVLLAFIVCLASTLTAVREIPLADLDLSAAILQKKKTKVGKSKYRKFTNEDGSAEEDSDVEKNDWSKDSDGGLGKYANRMPSYGAVTERTPGHGDNYSNSSSSGNNSNKIRAISDARSPTGKVLTMDKIISGYEQKTEKGMCENVSEKENESDKEDCHSNPRDPSWVPHDVRSQKDNTDEYNPQDGNPNMSGARTMSQTISQHYSRQNGPISDSISGQQDNRFQNGSRETSGNSLFSQPDKAVRRLSDDEFSPYTDRHVADVPESSKFDKPKVVEVSTDVTLTTYLRSIVRMPRCMWVLCACNLFCWMSLVCYSLYFTDFVGELCQINISLCIWVNCPEAKQCLSFYCI